MKKAKLKAKSKETQLIVKNEIQSEATIKLNAILEIYGITSKKLNKRVSKLSKDLAKRAAKQFLSSKLSGNTQTKSEVV